MSDQSSRLNVINNTASTSSEAVKFDANKYRGKAAIVTLGCAKNQVDSEVMLGSLRKHGFEIVNEAGEADVVIVNTCSFLESAVKEGIDAILDIAELKETGRLRKLIVAGCMVSRYGAELKESLSEVDAFISLDEIVRAGQVASDAAGSELLADAARPYFLYDDSMPRVLSTKQHMAYVKISEGCNRPCTFCIIPKIRGEMRSRTSDSVVKEVLDLKERGVREINLVGQDLTAYGSDNKEMKLHLLLEKLAETNIDWIRLLYAYPVGITDELLDTIMNVPEVCEYLDLPLQHASERVLKTMKRPTGRFATKPLIEYIKTRQPDISMRTTFIVGFPGETESDVKELEDLVLGEYFDNVGVFTYSLEKGTPSYDMSSHVSEEEKQERKARIMAAQKSVLDKKLKNYIGKDLKVLLEGTHSESDLLLEGRARFQAPDVDGSVIVNDVVEGLDNLTAGTMCSVEITDVLGYDLVGTLKGVI